MSQPKTININNNCSMPENHQSMSRSGNSSYGMPNQAQWKNNHPTDDYEITLLPDSSGNCSWDLSGGNPPSFTVAQGRTSAVYQLLPTAPFGMSRYQVKNLHNLSTCRESDQG